MFSVYQVDDLEILDSSEIVCRLNVAKVLHYMY